MISASLYRTQIVPTATPAQVGQTGKRRLVAVLLYSAGANSSVEFKNAATDTGDVLLTFGAPANGPSVFLDFSDIGGLEFSTAIYCKPAGTGALVYVWFE